MKLRFPTKLNPRLTIAFAVLLFILGFTVVKGTIQIISSSPTF